MKDVHVGSDKVITIERMRDEENKVYYEAMAPDGFCFMPDGSEGLLWSLIGCSVADCENRIMNATLLRCDDDADLGDDYAAILAANGIEVEFAQ